jgi:hypothetical protein
MDGVYVRLEANWPPTWPIPRLNSGPSAASPGLRRWIAAQNENGVTINGIFDDQTPIG